MSTHVSVLLDEAVEALDLVGGDVVVDATLGGGGHFGKILERLSGEGTAIGIDADHEAIERAEAVSKTFESKDLTVHLVENNFRNLDEILDSLDIEAIDASLFDLGWSSFQLERGRGFSFKTEEPLLMTYGEPTSGKTAADLVNSASEEALSELIYTFGEERFARSIAASIVTLRKEKSILTTGDLVDAVMKGTPRWYHHRRLHPATKTFQALRIAVNDELQVVREGLQSALTRTRHGGRIAVITFHSIEDRIVKGIFRDAQYQGLGASVTKKPIAPSAGEIARNPRARSAKLRVFERGKVASLGEKLTQSRYTYA
ncbi:MAG: 16S rRNA (cytosine(1402)-N(4))-methyltransferase RsmH [Candidatus Pacebacteria bacterium]|nr:16S rRNA (cytosine(1402)-N(4))-methyltransferase RsmH [Candidatus Paceibacterota bacterium]